MEPAYVIINVGAGVVVGMIGTTTIFDPKWLRGKPWYVWIGVLYALLACIGVIAVNGFREPI